MTSRTLSENERAFLRALVTFTAEHGHPPTLRELGARIQVASTGTMRALHAQLALRGLVVPPNGSHRSLRVTGEGQTFAAGDAPWQAVDEAVEA